MQISGRNMCFPSLLYVSLFAICVSFFDSHKSLEEIGVLWASCTNPPKKSQFLRGICVNRRTIYAALDGFSFAQTSAVSRLGLGGVLT